jgi:hypothetical protein
VDEWWGPEDYDNQWLIDGSEKRLYFSGSLPPTAHAPPPPDPREWIADLWERAQHVALGLRRAEFLVRPELAELAAVGSAVLRRSARDAMGAHPNGYLLLSEWLVLARQQDEEAQRQADRSARRLAHETERRWTLKTGNDPEGREEFERDRAERHNRRSRSGGLRCQRCRRYLDAEDGCACPGGPVMPGVAE